MPLLRQRRFGCARSIAIFLLAAITVSSASAQTLPQEYSTLIRGGEDVGPLGASPFRDRIESDSGAVVFVARDVSLPGNDALPVAIGRRYVVQTNPAGVVPER